MRALRTATAGGGHRGSVGCGLGATDDRLGRRLGGLVTLQIARGHPQQVSGLVLDSLIVHPPLRDLFGGPRPVFDRLDSEQPPSALEIAIRQSCASQFAGTAPELVAKFLPG